MQCNQGTKIKNKVLQESIEFKQNLELEKKFYFWAILSLRYEIPFLKQDWIPEYSFNNFVVSVISRYALLGGCGFNGGKESLKEDVGEKIVLTC